MQHTKNQKSLFIYKKIWAKMVMGRNGHGPKWSWIWLSGRNDPEPDKEV